MIGSSVDLATMTLRPFDSVRSTTRGTAMARTGPGAGGAMRWPSGSSSLAARMAAGTVR